MDFKKFVGEIVVEIWAKLAELGRLVENHGDLSLPVVEMLKEGEQVEGAPEWTKRVSATAFADWDARIIWVSPATLTHGELVVKNLLVHELVHLYDKYIHDSEKVGKVPLTSMWEYTPAEKKEESVRAPVEAIDYFLSPAEALAYRIDTELVPTGIPCWMRSCYVPINGITPWCEHVFNPGNGQYLFTSPVIEGWVSAAPMTIGDMGNILAGEAPEGWVQLADGGWRVGDFAMPVCRPGIGHSFEDVLALIERVARTIKGG